MVFYSAAACVFGGFSRGCLGIQWFVIIFHIKITLFCGVCRIFRYAFIFISGEEAAGSSWDVYHMKVTQLIGLFSDDQWPVDPCCKGMTFRLLNMCQF